MYEYFELENELGKMLYNSCSLYNKLQDANKVTTTRECAVADCGKTAKMIWKHTLQTKLHWSYTPQKKAKSTHVAERFQHAD